MFVGVISINSSRQQHNNIGMCTSLCVYNMLQVLKFIVVVHDVNGVYSVV